MDLIKVAKGVQVIDGFLDQRVVDLALSQLPLSDLEESVAALASPWRQQVHLGAAVSASVHALCECATSETQGALPAGVAWGDVSKHRDWHVALAPAKPAQGRVAVIYLTGGGRLVFHGKVRSAVRVAPGRLVSWDAELEHSFEADAPSGVRAMIGPLAMHGGTLQFCIPADQDWEDDPVSIQAARNMGRQWNVEDERKIEEAAAGIGYYGNQKGLDSAGIKKLKEEVKRNVEAEAIRRGILTPVIVTVHIDDQRVECTTMDGEVITTLGVSTDVAVLGDVRRALSECRPSPDPLMLITIDGAVLDQPDDLLLTDVARVDSGAGHSDTEKMKIGEANKIDVGSPKTEGS